METEDMFVLAGCLLEVLHYYWLQKMSTSEIQGQKLYRTKERQ